MARSCNSAARAPGSSSVVMAAAEILREGGTAGGRPLPGSPFDRVAPDGQRGRGSRVVVGARVGTAPSLPGARGGADVGHGLRPGGVEVSAGRFWRARQLRAVARGLPDVRRRYLDRHAGRGGAP